MADRPSLAAAALVLACGAGFVAACEGSSGRPEAPAPHTPSPDVAPQPATPAATASASATSAPRDAECIRAEKRAARSIWLGDAVGQVTAAPTGYSDTARGTVVKQTAKVGGRLLEQCGGRQPPAFERFSHEIRATLAADDGFGDAQLDEVLAAWVRWGSAVGASQAARREVRVLEYCRREVLPLVDVTVQTRSEVTATGRAWWVDLEFDNRTGEVLDGGMHGTASATKMLDDPFGSSQGPRPGPGRNATLTWGGSSADVLQLQPGTTMLAVAPDIDSDVHTTADGTFRVTEIVVGLGPRGGISGCSLPVRPLPESD